MRWRRSGTTPPTDAAGAGRAAVVNDDIGDSRAAGLLVSWSLDGLPHLAQWTMPAAGMYVVGLEPATVGLGAVEAVDAAEAAGTLRLLDPGERATLALDLTFLHGPDDVASARARTTAERGVRGGG